MRDLVQINNDPDFKLYYADTVPKDLVVVKVDMEKLLKSLEHKLQVFEVEESDWLYCAISLELPAIPVSLKEASIDLYNKADLMAWLTFDHRKQTEAGVANPKLSDPLKRSDNVTIDSYVELTLEDIVDYFITKTGIPIEALIESYVANESTPAVSPFSPMKHRGIYPAALADGVHEQEDRAETVSRRLLDEQQDASHDDDAYIEKPSIVRRFFGFFACESRSGEVRAVINQPGASHQPGK